jgi:hypothetical protein
MALIFQDMLRTDGRDNDGGLLVFAYWALYTDILTFPKVPVAPTTLAEKVTIADPFVMKQGKRFWQFQSTLLTSSLDGEGVGERDGRSAENKVTLKRVGNEAEVIGWVEQVKNSDLVLIVSHINGNKRVIGSEGLPASLEKFTIKSGGAVKDEISVVAEFMSVGRIAPFYTAAVPLTPAV